MSAGPTNVVGLPIEQSERYMTVKEFAALVRVHPTTVGRWIRDGMPSETWGRRMRRILPSRALAWLRAQEYPDAPRTQVAPGDGANRPGGVAHEEDTLMSTADPSVVQSFDRGRT